MESWTMQNRLKYLWVREKKKKQRSKIINFYYCKSLCYLTAGNSKHNIQIPKARRGVELGGKKKQWACWIILRPLLITSNVVEGKVSARRRDNFRMNLYFWNQTVWFAENIKDNLADYYCSTLFLVTGIVVVVTNGQRFRVFIQIPIAARTDGASCAGIPHDLHWRFLCNVEKKNDEC